MHVKLSLNISVVCIVHTLCWMLMNDLNFLMHPRMPNMIQYTRWCYIRFINLTLRLMATCVHCDTIHLHIICYWFMSIYASSRPVQLFYHPFVIVCAVKMGCSFHMTYWHLRFFRSFHVVTFTWCNTIPAQLRRMSKLTRWWRRLQHIFRQMYLCMWVCLYKSHWGLFLIAYLTMIYAFYVD